MYVDRSRESSCPREVPETQGSNGRPGPFRKATRDFHSNATRNRSTTERVTEGFGHFEKGLCDIGSVGECNHFRQLVGCKTSIIVRELRSLCIFSPQATTNVSSSLYPHPDKRD